MTVLSLREAALEAGTSKSTILRAIQSGRLSAPRNDDGGYAIDPAELFRVFPPGAKRSAADRSVGRAMGQDAPVEGPGGPEARAIIAALEVEIRGLKDLLDEVKRSRDDWRDQLMRLTNAIPDLRANKGRHADSEPAASTEVDHNRPAATGGPPPRMPWWRRFGLAKAA